MARSLGCGCLMLRRSPPSRPHADRANLTAIAEADHKRERKRARDRRRYRREIAGLKVAPVEYSGELVDYLAKYGWLRKSDKDNPHSIGRAISRAMKEAAELDAKIISGASEAISPKS
ncbi:hypothetical protein G6321_00011875 [Bradyrhizobium barranii subsp. barranii]|uniref:Uncharacterized protein n=1 Tax=Bradyrhizobium barranii subsp. barranii TaxID=2823807 RepID=A0A7Z0Q5A8_9BRAD|nr:hypothetical protein [Bradyrhizobium barranii]UGX95789.1 hypothetical protein G6321_00011875 [Bradyrhizobium barranii subsp. barranii]